jgi:hypothetical protein
VVSGVALVLVASVMLAPSVRHDEPDPATSAHPMHSTLAEVVEDHARRTLRVTIRVFADDFGLALTRASRATAAAGGPSWEADAARYTASVVGVRDSRGRTLALHPCGIHRASGVVWLCLETDAVMSTQGLQLRDAMLCELYDDQVNVVQGVFDGARRSLLFVRGDGYKPLR